MSEQSTWLVKFGIGNVQSFITQSRQVRDLAASSAIVARVAAAMVKSVPKCCTPVLPAEWPKGGVADAHQVVLSVPANEVECILKRLCDDARKQWCELLCSGIEHFNSEYEKSIDPKKDEIQAQLLASLDLFGVAIQKEGMDREAFAEVSACLDDRKNNTRATPPLVAAWGTPTCSLCGQRPSLLVPPEEGWPTKKPYLRKKECLCAVCGGKRFWAIKEDISYKSTHYFGFYGLRSNATLEEVLGHKREQVVSGLLKGLSAIHTLDADTLENVVNKVDETVSLDDDTKARVLEQLQKTDPYLAIIVMDGDDMGEWTRGDRFDSVGITAGDDFLEQLKEISDKVGEFSGGLNGAITGTGAELIYGGGDDALLLAPLDSLFPVVIALKKLWDDTVGGLYEEKGPTATLHASVIHAKEPLQDALTRAFDGLLRAKETYDGKACFSVTFEARSSSSRNFTSKWGEGNANLEHFRNAVELVSGAPPKGLAAGLYNKLIAESELCFDPTRGWAKDREILKRKLDFFYNRSGSSATSRDAWIRLLGWVLDHAAIKPSRKSPGGRPFFESALITAQSLARRGN